MSLSHRWRVISAIVCALMVALGACAPTPGPPTAPPVPAPTAAATGSGKGLPQASAVPGAPPDWVQAENAKAGDPGWKVPAAGLAKPDVLSAYASAASVTSGDKFDLYVHSTLGAVVATAYRVGWYSGVGGRVLWRSAQIPAAPQPKAILGPQRQITAPWQSTMTVPTLGWPEGAYLVVVTAGSKSTYVPVVIRSTALTGRTVVISAVTTLQAYNAWGGYSAYKGPGGSDDRSRVVSFDRPYDNGGMGQFGVLELEAIQYIESLGLNLAYLTSIELDASSDAVVGAAAVVSLAHDEYYSVEMRQALERGVSTGTNLAFLGGNGMYWRMRFTSTDLGRRRAIEIYRFVAEDPVPNHATTTTLWRQNPQPNYESRLMGVAYVCMNQPAPYVVVDPSFFAFDGTGAQAGSSYPGLVGIEVDRVPSAADVPANTRIVAHSPVICTPSLQSNTSDSTYYSAPSGAGVFAVGSLAWLRSVQTPYTAFGATAQSVAFVQRVTANVLRAFSTPGAGARHPSATNIESIYGPPAPTTPVPTPR